MDDCNAGYYKINGSTNVVNDWRGISVVADTDDDINDMLIDAVIPDYHRLEAQVRSEDFFVTLATKLDSLSSRIDDYTTRITLEDIISDLIQMQDHYKVERKKD